MLASVLSDLGGGRSREDADGSGPEGRYQPDRCVAGGAADQWRPSQDSRRRRAWIDGSSHLIHSPAHGPGAVLGLGEKNP